MISKNLLEKICMWAISLEFFGKVGKIRNILEYKILTSLVRLALKFTAPVKWDSRVPLVPFVWCVSVTPVKSETNTSCYKSWERQSWNTKALSYIFLLKYGKKNKKNWAPNCKLKESESRVAVLALVSLWHSDDPHFSNAGICLHMLVCVLPIWSFSQWDPSIFLLLNVCT